MANFHDEIEEGKKQFAWKRSLFQPTLINLHFQKLFYEK
jgi:hypothetical protein